MRIILLRLLISWWSIPVMAVCMVPIYFLMMEKKDAIDTIKEVVEFFWNGFHY